MTSNQKGTVEIGNGQILLNGTQWKFTAGDISIITPIFNLYNSQLSNGAQSKMMFFAPVQFQGTSSSLSNSGFMSLSSSVSPNQSQGTFTNSGTLSTPTGNNITIGVHLTNSGNATFSLVSIYNYTQTKGNTYLENGKFSSPSPILINGGQLQGSSNISGDLVANGNSIIGSNTTITNLIISGSFNHSVNATLYLTVDSATNISVFTVGGQANIQGSLSIFVLNPIDKNANLTLLSFGSVVGNFSSVNIQFPNNDEDDEKCQQVYTLADKIIVNFGCPPPNKLSPGAIAAIVFGCLAFVLILAGLGYFVRRYYQSQKTSDEHSPLLN